MWFPKSMMDGKVLFCGIISYIALSLVQLFFSPVFAATAVVGNSIDCNRADLNEDGTVDILDVIACINAVLDNGGNQRADVNGDGSIDILDVIRVVNEIIGTDPTGTCTDADGDHYFVESSGCAQEPGYLGHNDCDDNNSNVHGDIACSYITINALVYTNNGNIEVPSAIENVNTMITAKRGENTTLIFKADSTFDYIKVQVDGGFIDNSHLELVDGDYAYTFQNISKDHTLAVGFFNNSSQKYTITPIYECENCTENCRCGTTVPSGEITANVNDNITFRILPDRGCTGEKKAVDGYDEFNHYHPYYGIGSFVEFENLDADHNFHVKFKESNSSSAYKTYRDLKLWQAEMAVPENVINPNDIEYIGAFKVPGDKNGSVEASWAYNAGGVAYYPHGDAGNTDAYPGSLFGFGHTYQGMLSEITIPEPVVSHAKDINDLNTAVTIQPFVRVDNNIVEATSGPSQGMGGLTYLAPQGDQTEGKLYWGKGKHFPDNSAANHGWSSTNLSQPNSAGLWRVGDVPTVNTGYIMFEIPQSWANQYADGKTVATGRNRWGQGTYANGPALFAIGPWQEGNPPPENSEISYKPLIKYNKNGEQLDGYSIADVWGGGAWLENENRSAVIFGAKVAYGRIWYGSANYSTRDNRGMHGDNRKVVLKFYNPEDLARVATGEDHYPQPYATLNITKYLFSDFVAGRNVQESGIYFSMAYDRERNYLYFVEKKVDGARPIIHVFQIK